METTREQKLIGLAIELQKLEREIVKARMERGKEDINLREKFIETKNNIKEILGDSGAIDKISNPQIIDILRKVRSGNFFTIDKEARQLEDMFRNLPFATIEKIFKNFGIEASETEVDGKFNDTIFNFQLEITEKIDCFDYFDRKEKISTIIVSRQLPKKIHKYFDEVKACFLYGQMLAVLGLCRVMLEIAFKDKYKELGLAKKKSNVSYIEDQSISNMIYEVCSRRNLRPLIAETKKLYFEVASAILHGDDTAIELTTQDVLKFVQKVYNVIEKLYA